MKNYNLLIQGEQEAHDGSLRSFGTKTYDKKRSYLFRILSRRAILTILHSPPFSFSGRVLRKRRAMSEAKGEGKEYNAGIFQIDYGYAFRCKGIFGKLRVTRSDEVFQSYTKDQKNKRDSPRIGSARDQATNKYKLSGGVVIFAYNMTRSRLPFRTLKGLCQKSPLLSFSAGGLKNATNLY